MVALHTGQIDPIIGRMEPVTRILLAAGPPLVRASLASLLRSQRDLELVGEAATPADAMAAVGRVRPDVVLVQVDGSLDDWDGLLTASAEPGAARVVLLAPRRDMLAPETAIERGARGVLDAGQSPDLLFKALRRVRQGEYWIDRSGVTAILERRRRRELSPEQARIASLTPRERQIIGLVGEGLKNHQVAARLRISEATVRNHLTSILDKLDVDDRYALALFGLRHGLLPCPGCGRTHAVA